MQLQTPSIGPKTPLNRVVSRNAQFPGEEFLAHPATQYSEQAETQLAARKLLVAGWGSL